MTSEQQNAFIYEILKFTMPDQTPVSHEEKAEVIIAELGLPDVPQLRRLIALGVSRHDQRVRRGRK